MCINEGEVFRGDGRRSKVRRGEEAKDDEMDLARLQATTGY